LPQFSGLILAAGQGTRMNSVTHKALHPILGTPIIRIIVKTLREAGIMRPAVVVGYQASQIRTALGDAVDYVYQETQLGTGHAVLQARDEIARSSHVLVMMGDTPLVEAAALRRLMEAHCDSGAAATVLTAVVDDPSGLGRIVRSEHGSFVVVEDSDLEPGQRDIREINTGIGCYRSDLLLEFLPRLAADNSQGERYLLDVLPLIRESGHVIASVRESDGESFLGVNTQQELARANSVYRDRILQGLMSRGITIIDPATTWIGPEVEVEPGVTILPQCTIMGRSEIGSGTLVGPVVHLVDTSVGQGCHLWYSVLEGSRLGAEVTVGPFAHLRPGVELSDRVKVGNFAELKNSTVGKGSKIPHHSYVGDTDIGAGVNFGAGAVTVNYDGMHKHRTHIGDGAFVGCNVNLLAPITISPGALVAAGSTVNEDVPEDSLAIARERQTNKPGWVRRRRPKGEG